jgi:hypothetical protein
MQSMLSNCRALPPGVTRVGRWRSLYSVGVVFDFSGTHGKTCVYSSGTLSHAAAWADTPTYCNGTSSTIVSQPGTESLTTATIETRLCDNGATVGSVTTWGWDASAGPEPVPPATCYNLMNGECQVCCPDKQTACATSPYSYPGYACTPRGVDYCSCQCQGVNSWLCGC